MTKTLNELSRELRDFLVEIQSDAHNVGSVKAYRYNNLKIQVSDPRTVKTPQVIVTIGMSEASFNLLTNEKVSGGLGPEERYVIRWFDRGSNKEELKDAYRRAEKQIGKAKDPE